MAEPRSEIVPQVGRFANLGDPYDIGLFPEKWDVWQWNNTLQLVHKSTWKAIIFPSTLQQTYARLIGLYFNALELGQILRLEQPWICSSEQDARTYSDVLGKSL